MSLALKRSFVFQGFLSDLLKKANRPYDEPKLQEYTQTIVSGQMYPFPGEQGLGHKPLGGSGVQGRLCFGFSGLHEVTQSATGIGGAGSWPHIPFEVPSELTLGPV